MSRPASPHSEVVHALFGHVRAAGFDGVAEPVGIDPDGRERLAFIPGEVAVPPFPDWSRTVQALASVAELLARFHDAARGFEAPSGTAWNGELADPAGGSMVCHNDVCPEDGVFQGGTAVALLDFDFAAPGRPLYDLATMARMCVPLDAPADALVGGRGSFDPFGRLRLAADRYGLPPGREELVRLIEESMAQGGDFVRRRVERGEPAFVEMWEQMGGQPASTAARTGSPTAAPASSKSSGESRPLPRTSAAHLDAIGLLSWWAVTGVWVEHHRGASRR